MGLWDIEVEPGVRAWLENLPKRDFGHVLAHVEKLAEEAETLGEPYSRYLGDKTRELRIPLHPLDVRVTRHSTATPKTSLSERYDDE
jgi:hypothetical protein